ncbi:uncharacterized protein F4822DRAFT_430911 [Hypoxylon trugodes]|uniref:uncharacterized protein n=1 Tax=Hypoxylon trugodes TaxID=326681 RepID=UPI00219ABF56|nr:uncharacterized protein F4822DRAFT_430911 [Hypoxylon trugodes]KAI1388156.1 hypothetical protein F4822DRAFT_430911 [Hypoxylon trugodes]
MSPSQTPLTPLSVPPSNATVKISIIDSAGRLGRVPSKLFFEPHIEGFEYWTAPSYSFLIEHGSSGDKLLFDLGIRKDLENLPPVIQKLVEGWELSSHKNVSDVLVENGVDLRDIKTIIWSHRHFDHTGDPSVFPFSTDLVVGPGLKKIVGEGYPIDEESICSTSAWEGRNFIELDFETDRRVTSIGRWKAIDWFEDGSFYLLHSIGHTMDHLSGFARTKLAAQSITGTDEFILMGGDVAHHGGEFRPNRFLPIPTEISPDPRLPPYCGGFCLGAYYAQRNMRHNGDDCWNTPFLKSAKPFLDDEEKAEWSLDVIGEFDVHDNVFVIFAHDNTLLNVVDLYPKEATEWKEKGWKREGRWRFLEDLKGHN